jgi:hypothetical protein
VHYRPVIDYIPLPMALDPLWTMIFMAVFIATVALVVRRASYGIAALVVTQPFLFSRYVGDVTITLPNVALLGVLVGLGAQTEWLELLRSRRVRATLIALAIFTALAALYGTLGWIEYLVLFWLVCVAYRRDPNDGLLLRAWAVTGIIVAVLALGQEIVGAPRGLAINGVVVPRIAWPLGSPDRLAAYLGILLAVLCVWQGRSRLVSVAIVLALWALGLTFSPAGVICAAIAIAIVLVFGAPLRRKLVAPLATGVVLAVASAGAWFGIAHVPGALPSASLPSYAGIVEARTRAIGWYPQSLVRGGIVLFAATIGLVATVLASLGARLKNASPWQLAAFAASVALVVHETVASLAVYPKIGGTWWIAVALGVTSVLSR